MTPDGYGVPVPEQILVQAGLHPHRPAVICGSVVRTYQDIVSDAQLVGAALLARELAPETHVIVCMPRSDDLVVALVGVMLAGLAYVPVEPDTPPARKAAITQQCGAGLVLTSLPPRDDAGERWCRPPGPTAGSALAYTIFTSGSSGVPKGVSLPHEAVAHFLHAADPLLDNGRRRRVLASTSIAFDVSALELFWPLARGHTVYMATADDLSDPRRLLDLIVRHEIDLVQATPSRWAMITGMAAVPAGTTVLSGGETLPAPLAADLLRCGVQLINFYGPTETCIYSLAGAVSSAEPPIVLGEPLGETTLSIRGPGGRPVPNGSMGELWIGGPGLARGYLNDPRRTAAAFVPDDQAPPGRRAYRTGDQVMRGTSGIEFRGRTDDQIKLRGARVELGDVESAVQRVPEVVLAVAVVVDAALWVFYTTAHGRPVSAVDAAVARELPGYMYPDEFVHVAEMPLTVSGKADRGALRGHAERAESGHSPRSTAELISTLLGRTVGSDDDLFDAGATSLAAARLALRIARQFGVAISVGDIARLRSARAIDAAIRQAGLPPV